MYKEELKDLLIMFTTGVMIGALIAFIIVGPLAASSGQEHIVKWVEHCWPNKPSWKDDWGTCWENGDRIRRYED